MINLIKKVNSYNLKNFNRPFYLKSSLGKLSYLCYRIFILKFISNLVIKIGNRLKDNFMHFEHFHFDDKKSIYKNSVYDSEENELNTALKNRNGENNNVLTFQITNKIAYHASDVIDKLTFDDNNLSKFAEIGASYAYISKVVSEETKLYTHSFDRSLLTKEFNIHYFQNRKKMNFHHGDLNSFISSQCDFSTIFFTKNVLCYFDEEQIDILFTNLSKNNTKYIMFYETSGYSSELKGAFTYSLDYKKSALQKGQHKLHNYPYFLEKYGYDLIRFELINLSHPEYDYLFLLAKLNMSDPLRLGADIEHLQPLETSCNLPCKVPAESC